MWRRSIGAGDTHPGGGPDARSARWSRWLTIGAALLFLLLVTRWHPWHLFDRAGFTNDFYDAQARAMLHLRFDVPPKVAGPEGFIIDGKTYVYFGPLLSVARFPFVLFGHAFDGRLTRISLVLGFVVFCTAAYHLAIEARRLVAARRPDRPAEHDHLRIAAFVGACALSPALVLAGWTTVYHETEMWGAAFCAWTMVHAIRFAEEPTRRNSVLTVALASATLLTRATMGFGAALVAGLVALLISRRDRRRTAFVVAGTAAGAVVHFVVSYVKLGSFVEMPWLRQQLTTVSPTRQAWFAGNGDSFFSIRFLPTTLLQYLRPDAIRVERLAPFIRFGPLASDVGGYPLETNTPSSSLSVTATLLVVLAIAGVVTILRWRAWSWMAAFAGGALAAVPSFLIGFIAARYLADMVPMLMAPAAVGAIALRRPRDVRARRVVTVGVTALIVWGAWTNAAFATWIDQLKNPGFTAWRYELDDRIFGDPAPSLVVLDMSDPTAHMPHDGTVGLRLDATGAGCDGVYIVEQGAWAVLERSDGTIQLTGHLAVGGVVAAEPVLLVAADDWAVQMLAGIDGTTQFTVLRDGVETATAIVDRRVDVSTQVRVVADTLTKEMSVRLDGEVALFSFDVPTATMSPGEHLLLTNEPTDTLCRQLLARR